MKAVRQGTLYTKLYNYITSTVISLLAFLKDQQPLIKVTMHLKSETPRPFWDYKSSLLHLLKDLDSTNVAHLSERGVTVVK